MTQLERRAVELRSEVKGSTLHGYASVFGTYADLGSYVETFAHSAFDNTLSNPASDVRAFYQHDSKTLLGRQKSGTLKLWKDSTGLGFELSLPEFANEVRELAERGDLGGMSIGFIPGDETPGTLGGRRLRTHTSVAALIEISPVSIPAYADTTVQLRSLEHINTTADMNGRTQLARAEIAHYINR